MATAQAFTSHARQRYEIPDAACGTLQHVGETLQALGADAATLGICTHHDQQQYHSVGKTHLPTWTQSMRAGGKDCSSQRVLCACPLHRSTQNRLPHRLPGPHHRLWRFRATAALRLRVGARGPTARHRRAPTRSGAGPAPRRRARAPRARGELARALKPHKTHTQNIDFSYDAGSAHISVS